MFKQRKQTNLGLSSRYFSSQMLNVRGSTDIPVSRQGKDTSSRLARDCSVMWILTMMIIFPILYKGEFSVRAQWGSCNENATPQVGDDGESGVLDPEKYVAKSEQYPALEYNGHFVKCFKTQLQNTGVILALKLMGEYVTNISISAGPLQGNYRLHQVNFNWGKNKKYPLEIHMVHYDDNYTDINAATGYHDGVAMVVFICEVQNVMEATAFGAFVEHLPKFVKANASDVIESNLLVNFAPQAKPYEYLTYTTKANLLADFDTCYKNVIWIVYNSTIPIKQEEVDLFTSLNNVDGKPITETFRRSSIPEQDAMTTFLKDNLFFAPDPGYNYKDTIDWISR